MLDERYRVKVRDVMEYIALLPIRDSKKMRLLRALKLDDSEHFFAYGDFSQAASGTGISVEPAAVSGDVSFMLALVDYEKDTLRHSPRETEAFTVSLLRPDGSVYSVQRTDGSRVCFGVPAADNARDGNWGLRVESSGSYRNVGDILALSLPGLVSVAPDEPETLPSSIGQSEPPALGWDRGQTGESQEDSGGGCSAAPALLWLLPLVFFCVRRGSACK